MLFAGIGLGLVIGAFIFRVEKCLVCKANGIVEKVPKGVMAQAREGGILMKKPKAWDDRKAIIIPQESELDLARERKIAENNAKGVDTKLEELS